MFLHNSFMGTNLFDKLLTTPMRCDKKRNRPMMSFERYYN